MTLEKRISKLFKMSDDVWARHANPWSVWTRYSTLPLLALSVWSRAWIGWWSLVPIAAALIWVYINPRIFNKPKTTKSWTSKAVLGERVWLNRKNIPVPSHHYKIINFLTVVSSIGAIICVYGLIVLSPWPTVFGIVVVFLGKTWFLDRMVWIYEEMKNNNYEYRSWLY
jgi:hypothetical protein